MAMGCMRQECHQFDRPFVKHQVWMTQQMNLVQKFIFLVQTMLKIWFKVDLILVYGQINLVKKKNGSNLILIGAIMIYFGVQIILSLKLLHWSKLE